MATKSSGRFRLLYLQFPDVRLMGDRDNAIKCLFEVDHLLGQLGRLPSTIVHQRPVLIDIRLPIFIYRPRVSVGLPRLDPRLRLFR
jgi:hypothetical protein